MKKFNSFLLSPFSFLLILLLFNDSLLAQSVSGQVKSDYPSSVVAQVFDLVVKAGLNDSEQLVIAGLMLERDKKMHEMLQGGASNKEVLDAKGDYENQINEKLNAEQKYNIYVARVKENARNKYTYSQFAIAIRYKDSLDLSPVQVTALMYNIELLKKMKNNHYATTKKSLDTRAFESGHISEILTNSQYGQLLIYKNQSKAEAYAEKDWTELVQRSLDSAYIKVDVINELTNYYLARQCTYTKYEHDLIRQKAEVKELYYHRPQVIKVLQKARRNPDNNTMGGGFNGGG